MKLFRTFRQKSVLAGRVKKYLVYAIGEVILLVIGILIALQINNWNENRKHQDELSGIYETVLSDLHTDTTVLTYFIKSYDQLDSMLSMFAEPGFAQSYFDTINESNYHHCKYCGLYISAYSIFQPQEKGFHSLEDIEIDPSDKSASLAKNILTFYSFIEQIKPVEEGLADLAKNNLYFLEQYDWFGDFYYQTYRPEALDFLASSIYRNKVITFQILVIGNYRRELVAYKKNASMLIQQIEDHLDDQ